jgi:hypothetical protein
MHLLAFFCYTKSSKLNWQRLSLSHAQSLFGVYSFTKGSLDLLLFFPDPDV